MRYTTLRIDRFRVIQICQPVAICGVSVPFFAYPEPIIRVFVFLRPVGPYNSHSADYVCWHQCQRKFSCISFGGLVVAYAGCEYYSYFPEKLKGLILLEPSFDFSDDIYGKMPDFGGKVMIFAGKAQGSIGGGSPDKLENAKKAFQNADIRYFEGEDHYFHGPERVAMIQASIDFIRNNMEKN